MIFLYILVAVVLLLLLLLFSQLRFKLSFDGEFSMKMYIGIFKIPLRTESKKTEKQENNGTPKDKKKKKNKYFETIRKKGFSESFSAIIDFLKPVFTELFGFSSHIKINPLYIKIVLTGDDAAKLAIDYGKFCAVFYPALNFVLSRTHSDNYSTDISVDYVKTEMEIYAYGTVKFRIIHSVKSAIILIKEFLKLKSKFN